MSNEDEWTIQMTRQCQACGGTGRHKYEFPRGGFGGVSPPPYECQVCDGPGIPNKIAGREVQAITIQKLKELLAAAS